MHDLSQRSGELASLRHGVLLRELCRAVAEGPPLFAWSSVPPSPAGGGARSTPRGPAAAGAGAAGAATAAPLQLLLHADQVARAVLDRTRQTQGARVRLQLAELVAGRGAQRAEVCTSAIEAGERHQMREALHELAALTAQAFADTAAAVAQTPEGCARAVLGTVAGTSPFGAAAPRAQDELARLASTTRQRLTFHRPRTAEGTAARPLMRWHKATLRIAVPEDALHQLGAGVRAWLEARLPTRDHGELRALIDEKVAETSPDAEFIRLLRLLDTETVGQLRKAALVTYLDYLQEHLDEVALAGEHTGSGPLAGATQSASSPSPSPSPSPHRPSAGTPPPGTPSAGTPPPASAAASAAPPQGAASAATMQLALARTLLVDLRRRMQALQTFVADEARSDEEFLVTCAGQLVNLRTLFAQADAWDDLPVVPLIDGFLGESTDWMQGQRSYVFGLKLKLNGPVARYDEPSSFHYHLALLRGQHSTSPERLLRLAVLYAVVFPHAGDLTFDPIAALQRDVLPALRAGSGGVTGAPSPELAAAADESIDAATRAVCRQVAGACGPAHAAVQTLATQLRALLRRETQRPAARRQVKIALRGGIVETQRATVLGQGIVLRTSAGAGAAAGRGAAASEAVQARGALRYVEIVEPTIQRGALLTLPAEITIEDVHCYEAEPTAERCDVRHAESGRARRLLPVRLRLELGERQDDARAQPPVPAPLPGHTPATPPASAPAPPQPPPLVSVPGAAAAPAAAAPAGTASTGTAPPPTAAPPLAAKPGLEVIARVSPGPPGTGVRGDRLAYYRRRPELWWAYWYCWSVVTLLGVQAVAAAADLAPDELFVSLVRLHQEVADDHDDADGMLATVGRALAHVLGADWLTGSQGLRVGASGSPAPERWRQDNAAASLYAALPKVFTFEQPLPDALPKLALVAVSSCKSDSLRAAAGVAGGAASYHQATVYGEVVGIHRAIPTTVEVRRLAAFTGTYPSAELYTRPSVILDQFTHLYAAGYRHIVYLARAPYSNHLHLTRRGTAGAPFGPESGATGPTAGDWPGDGATGGGGWGGGVDEAGEGLYFLSPAILTAALEGRPDLQIYPVFRDQYAAMRLRTPAARALYIQDTAELLRVADDAARHMAVFVNLFSGSPGIPRRTGRAGAVGGTAAGPEADQFYHGAVSYATLLNAYGGIVEERDLREALIHDAGGTNELKNLLVLYLSLFHLARYQVAPRGELTLKLDPFAEIIGDGSIGRRAVRQHLRGGLRFNYLGFLAEVRNITRDWARAQRVPQQRTPARTPASGPGSRPGSGARP